MKKRIIFLGIVWAIIVAPGSASAQSRSLIDEMQQRLLKMQQQMMQGLQGFNDGDTSGMYFHFDTSFNGGSAHFFRFTPPGDSMSGGNSDLEEFFRGMFDFGDPSGSAAQTFPRDDGNQPHPDDELLPEDRLREQEQQNAADPKTSAPLPQPIPAKKKPRVESIRI